MIKTTSLAWTVSAALGAVLIAVSVSSAAQSSPAVPAGQGGRVTLERFIVTGSLIPHSAGAPAIPVKVLGAQDIEQTGINTDLADVLRRSQPAFYGANNLGSDVANVNSPDSNGGSGLALRNRPTLVLVNGRRAALSPVLASGGLSFVDVSMIPLAAIERIEILSDGASATYGSDAVSGVINIILKTKHTGREVGGSYGFSTNEGRWANRSFFTVLGAKSGRTHVTATAEWKRSDPLIQYERPYSTGLFRTPTYAGVVSIGNDFYYLDPTVNAPPANLNLTPAQLVSQGIFRGPLTQTGASEFLDLANYPTLLAKAERRSLVAAVEHRVSNSMMFFADGIYTVNHTESVLNAQPLTGTIAAANPLNPFNVAVTARNRFISFPRVYVNESISMRGVAGVSHQFAGTWKYEVALNLNRTKHRFRNRNLIDGAKYNQLVASGAYNPFARDQVPGLIESMLGTQVRDYASTLHTLDTQLNGDAFELPGGPVKFGFGAGFKWDELSLANDRNDQTGGWYQATPRQPFNARSNVGGVFAEARIPIYHRKNAIPGVHLLEVSIAGRHDRYSTTSNPTTPKYTLRYMPFAADLVLRASYSESFVAPTLYNLHGPLTVGYTGFIDMIRYDSSGNPTGVATGPRQYRSQTGSNPNLSPSQSRNWSAGVVWSPPAIKEFSISFDWFSLDERDLIASIPASTIVNDVEKNGVRSPYASLVRLGPSLSGEARFSDGIAITAPGQVSSGPSDEVWISNSIVNVAGYWQQGFDFRGNYVYPSPSFGRFEATIAATYLHEYIVQTLPGGVPVGYQDGYFARGTSSAGVFPRYRVNSRIDWALDRWTAGIAHTYVPSLDDLTNVTPFRVANYQAFDFQIGRNFSGSNKRGGNGLRVTLGVNNAFNAFPPLIPSEGNQSRDINAYDPIGRFVYINAKYSF